MKRYGKCVGKVPHSSKATALRYIKNRYLQSGIKLRFYECPGCLDYHITSKPPFGPMEKDYARWTKSEATKKEKRRREAARLNEENRLKNISRDIIKKEYEEFNMLFRMTCYKLGVSVGVKKPPTVLKGVLPREERLRILAEMHSRQNPYIWGQVKKWFTGNV